jgi:hypothetical protein
MSDPGGAAAGDAASVNGVSPKLARITWRSLEAVHGMIYFTPFTAEPYARIGVVSPRMGYFASRVAALGAASAELTISTFYNFNPELVRRSIPAVWDITTPAKMLAARYDAVDLSLRKAFSTELLASAEFARAVELNRSAAEETRSRLEGRPLFAGHASLPWPDAGEPHLVLWHAQTLLREFRGDAHIAALVLEGLSGLEALVSHAASGDVPAAALIATRAWSKDQWEQAVRALSERGVVTGGVGDEPLAFTDAGRAQRDRIEAATDKASLHPYASLGEAGCDELRATGKVLSQAVVDAGLMTIDPNRFKD